MNNISDIEKLSRLLRTQLAEKMFEPLYLEHLYEGVENIEDKAILHHWDQVYETRSNWF